MGHKASKYIEGGEKNLQYTKQSIFGRVRWSNHPNFHLILSFPGGGKAELVAGLNSQTKYGGYSGNYVTDSSIQ